MKIRLNGKEVNAGGGSTVLDVLNSSGINPETVLVKRSRSLIPHDEILNDGDVLELIAVISGG